MVNTQFEAYKLQRELKRVGKEYEFERSGKNSFDEPTSERTVVCRLSGLYHEQNSSVSVKSGETTQTRTKKVPMILCLYNDAKVLRPGDIVKVNSKEFKVTGIVNIQEWNIIADVSLEVIDNGLRD